MKWKKTHKEMANNPIILCFIGAAMMLFFTQFLHIQLLNPCD